VWGRSSEPSQALWAHGGGGGRFQSLLNITAWSKSILINERHGSLVDPLQMQAQVLKFLISKGAKLAFNL
jgi:hypothetical protein